MYSPCHKLAKLCLPIKRTKGNFFIFLQGRIGVLGLNGSGKSTLLRIMAGIEKITWAKPATSELKIGYLPQEPKLDNEKSVKENIEELESY